MVAAKNQDVLLETVALDEDAHPQPSETWNICETRDLRGVEQEKSLAVVTYNGDPIGNDKRMAQGAGVDFH